MGLLLNILVPKKAANEPKEKKPAPKLAPTQEKPKRKLPYIINETFGDLILDHSDVTSRASKPVSISSLMSYSNIVRNFYNNVNNMSVEHELALDYKDPQFIVVEYLFDMCLSKGWFKLIDKLEPCVVKKNGKIGTELQYRYLPPLDDIDENSFVYNFAHSIRADVAIKVSFPVIHSILDTLGPDDKFVTLDDNHKIQMIDNVSELPWVRKYQYCTFVRDEKLLIAWSSNVGDLVKFVAGLENLMINYVWEVGNAIEVKNYKYVPRVTFADGFDVALAEIESVPESAHSSIEYQLADSAFSEKNGQSQPGTEGMGSLDLEKQVQDRPVFYFHAVAQGCALMLVMTWIGMMMGEATEAITAEGTWINMCALLYFPPFILFSGFFASAVVGVFMYILGPVGQVQKNSYSYSVHKAPRMKPSDGMLPHITIQCPVYKEGLDDVLKLTFQSVQKAIHTYELQGGLANVFVNDDGLQLIPREEALERIEFYEENGFGYVSRPPHGQNGFVRKGRFKKASNMNYCLSISSKVEDEFESMRSESEFLEFSPELESKVYLQALEKVVGTEESCWAGGDILLGEIILLIDSDTRIPEDCFLDAALEMHESPDVAILQHALGVMMVVNNYWEQLIAWFTELIYFSISYVSANGADTASFVGHNAFLRWQAIQECSYVDPDDNRTKYWSELHVSEDFEMSLKLGGLGYLVRVATYHDGGFKEGVSLTVYDEITRWSKYAYGCSEIMFFPMKRWIRGEVFTPLFKMFVKSDISYACKFSIISYMGTYFAIGVSMLMLVVNYFIIGYYTWGYSKIYVPSMKIFVSVMFVFSCGSQFAYIVGRYRINRTSVWKMFAEFRWSVLMAIYMGGLSFHMMAAVVCHLCSLNMEWGATAKTMDNSTFFQELPKTLKKYLWIYVASVLLIGMMLVFAYAVPYAYVINSTSATLPLGWSVACHILSPLLLNPQLMTFSW